MMCIRDRYTNVRYPIPLDPPYVPQENPCGAYVYKFDYKKQADIPRAYLNFEGVDSCFYVWINGKYVGYSQVSHACLLYTSYSGIIFKSDTFGGGEPVAKGGRYDRLSLIHI